MFAGGGRLEIHVTPADVGKRVSVRRVIGDAGGRPAFSDTVGVLTSWSGGVLIITRRNGEAVRIEEASLAAGKVVPDAPARRRGAAPAATAHQLREIAARGWPAQETEPLGGWLLRAAGGFTRRANSVLVQGGPGRPLDEALARAADWYGIRGLVPYVQIATGGPDGGDEELDAELERRGWPAEGHSLLRTAPLAPLADGPGAERVALSREPGAGWLERYHRTGDLAAAALKVLTGGPSVWFAEVSGVDGAPAAIGRCVVDGRWAGLAAIEVDPALRRQGLATAVVAALARRALDEGAFGAYLQVETGNDAARTLWDRMGFTTHHGYHYRCAPIGGTGSARG